MTVRYYMDHNVHRDITLGLRSRNIDCLTAAEDGRADEQDVPILNRATDLERVFVTGDQDFLQIAADRLAHGTRFTTIMFIRTLSVSVGEAIRDLELFAHAALPEEHENHVLYIPF